MAMPQSVSSQMEEIKNDWLIQVEADLRQAAQLIETLEQPGAADIAETSEELFRVFHDMKGQAPVFNYALLGSIATKFCTHWRHLGATLKTQDLHIARAHVVAARFVLEKRLEGCGGTAGPSIMAQLNSIIVKHGSSADF